MSLHGAAARRCRTSSDRQPRASRRHDDRPASGRSRPMPSTTTRSSRFHSRSRPRTTGRRGRGERLRRSWSMTTGPPARTDIAAECSSARSGSVVIPGRRHRQHQAGAGSARRARRGAAVPSRDLTDVRVAAAKPARGSEPPRRALLELRARGRRSPNRAKCSWTGIARAPPGRRPGARPSRRVTSRPSVSIPSSAGTRPDRRLDRVGLARRSGGRSTPARGCSRRSRATGTCRRRPCGTS